MATSSRVAGAPFATLEQRIGRRQADVASRSTRITDCPWRSLGVQGSLDGASVRKMARRVRLPAMTSATTRTSEEMPLGAWSNSLGSSFGGFVLARSVSRRAWRPERE
jgi:hypothetical protein